MDCSDVRLRIRVAHVTGMDPWNRHAVTGPGILTGGGGSTGTLGRAGWPGSGAASGSSLHRIRRLLLRRYVMIAHMHL